MRRILHSTQCSAIAMLVLCLILLSPHSYSQCSIEQEVGNNLIINGDFEDPEQTFTTEYADQFTRFPTGNNDCYKGSDCDPAERVAPDGDQCQCYRRWSLPGEYYVGSDVTWFHFNFTGTEDPTGGNVLFVDGSDEEDVKVWCQDVNILPNTTYYFSAQIASLGENATISANDASTLNFTIGNQVLGDGITTPTTVGVWTEKTEPWFSGGNSGTMSLCFTTTSSTGCTSCNDFAIDNIQFFADCNFGDDTPIPDLGEDLNICGNGGSLTLDPSVGPAGISYEWSTGETTPTIDVTAAGTYAVCVRNTAGGGCTRSDIINVVDDYSIDLGSDLELCNPPQVELDPQFDGPGVSFAWELDGQPIGGDTPTLEAGEPGTYTVTVSEPSCGDRTAAVNVTSRLVETEDFEYCPGDVEITATGSTIFNFYENEDDETPIFTGPSYTADLSAGGVHTFWVSDGERQLGSNVGPTSTAFTGENTDQGDRRMKFEVSQEMRLESVNIIPRFYGEQSLSGSIRLFNSSNGGTPVFQSDNITLANTTDNTTQTIDLEWDIEPGTYYLALGGNLRARFGDGNNVNGFPFAYDDSEGEEVFRLLGTTGSANDWNYDAIYFFFGWEVSTPSKCGKVPITATENCPCSNPDVELSGGSTVCEGEAPDDVVFTITPGDPIEADQWHIIYSIDGEEQPEEIVTDPSFVIQNPGAGLYELIEVYENENGGKCEANSLTGDATVEILSPPTVSIAGDADICQTESTTLEFTILGDGPFTLTWSDGTTETTQTGLANPHTETVTPDETTTYTIVTVTDAAAPQCPATDPSVATVTVTPPLSAEVTSLVCNGTATGYNVTIEISDAEAGTFDVTGDAGVLTNFTFVSDEIAEGDPYSFTVEPDFPCPSVELSDTYECPCLTDAGGVDGTLINACQGDNVAVTHDALDVLDENDILLFVMHDSPDENLGTVIAYSTSSVFPYDLDIVANQTYYISPIAGNELDGAIDLADPCLSIGPGTPVVYAPAPVAELTGTTSICPTGNAEVSIALSGTAPFDLTLSDDQGNDIDLTGVGANPPAQTVSPAVTSVYSVTALSDNSGSVCPFKSITEVTITVLPELQLFADEHNLTCFEACETGKGHAYVNAESESYVDNDSYEWFDAGATSLGTGPNIDGLCVGTYTVSVTNGFCSEEATITIAQPDELTASATGEDASCYGYEDGEVTGAGAGGSVAGDYGYEWDFAGIQANETGLFAGTYSVTVSDDSACTATANVTIGQPNEITVVVSNPIREICLGEGQTLSATASGGAGAPFNYAWTGDNSITNANTSNPTVAPTADTDYEVIVTDGNDCEAAPQIVSITLYDPVSVEAASDRQTICTNETVNLTYDNATGGSGNYNLTWFDGTNTFDALPGGNAVSIYELGTFEFTLTIEDELCADFDASYTYSAPTLEVSTSGAPDPTFNAATTQFCDRVIFDYERTTIDNIANETCTWTVFGGNGTNTNFESQNCAGTSATFYHDEVKLTRLVISNQFGCVDSFYLPDPTPTLPDPELSFYWEPETLTMLGSEATFFPVDSTEGDVNDYTWDFADGYSSDFENPIHEFPFNDAGVYPVELSAVNQYGCSSSVVIEVEVEGVWTFYVPSAFTPGDNGLNETFVPKNIGISTEVYELRIYDRWGEVVFESTDPYEPWDGTYQGEPLESTVYTWQVQTEASYDRTIPIVKRGRIALIR